MAYSKYKAVKTVIDGVTFDSKAEAKRYEILKKLADDKTITHLQLQRKFELISSKVKDDGKKERPVYYVADFSYVKDGALIVEDVKGIRLPVYVLKRKLMLSKYGITIKEIT